MFKYVIVWKPEANDLKVWSAETLDEARTKARFIVSGDEFWGDDVIEILDLSWKKSDGSCNNMLQRKDVEEWYR